MTFFLLLHHEKTAARQESAVFVWTAMQGNYISLTGVPFLRGADFLFAVLAVATVDSFALVALVVLAFAAPLLLAAAFGAFAGSAFAFAAVFLALAGAAFFALTVFFAFLGGTVSYLLPWTLGASTRAAIVKTFSILCRILLNEKIRKQKLNLHEVAFIRPCQGRNGGYAKSEESRG